MPDLALIHHCLVEKHHGALELAADTLLSMPSWSLEVPVVLIHTQSGGITLGPVLGLSDWLTHTPPELDPFMRLLEQGVSLSDAYQRCLKEQGQAFLDACEVTMASRALVSHDNLVQFAVLSQKGFARNPRELLVLAKWLDHVTAFLISCQQLV